MPRRARVAIVLAAVAAIGCSSAAPPPAPLANHAAAPADHAELARAALRRLADAVRDDRALGDVVDASDGAWLWHHPGAADQALAHVAPGDARPGSRIVAAGLADAHLPAAMGDDWRQSVARALDAGLAVVDTQGDPLAPRYAVDCSEGAPRPPARALLLAGTFHITVEPDVPAGAERAPLAYRFVYGAVEVYLSDRGGVVAVAHVLYRPPCEA